MEIQVLLAEDDVQVRDSIATALKAQHYSVAAVQTGEEAFFLASNQDFDVMVLDLGLPSCTGIEVLCALRNSGNGIPVLILSARQDVEARVEALRLGADDFLTKPFSLSELEARLRALLRRGSADTTTRFTVHDMTLDVRLRRVDRCGQVIVLTSLEFDLLELLISRARKVVSREEVVRTIWRDVSRATPIDNLIDVHVGRLRKKVNLPGKVPLIHTVRGVGFILTEKAL